jgi:hypothetical protein
MEHHEQRQNIGKLFVCTASPIYTVIYKKGEAYWLPQGCLLTLVNIENGFLKFLQEETIYCTPLVMWNNMNQDVKEVLKQLNLVAIESIESIEEAKEPCVKTGVKPIQLPHHIITAVGGATTPVTWNRFVPDQWAYTTTTTATCNTTLTHDNSVTYAYNGTITI